MPAIFIVTLLLLVGFDVVPSKVHAGSSRSSDSGSSSRSSDSSKSIASKDNDCCKNALKDITSITKKASLPVCTCGPAGTICKVNTFNANSGVTTTVSTCSGCSGPSVPITSSTECKNVPNIFRPDLETFCLKVYPLCKNVTVYRCECPPRSTTHAQQAPTIDPFATAFDEQPAPTY